VTKAVLTPKLLNLVAERFKALSDPVRLQILNELRSGEKSVTELIDATGCAQANVSKHLQLLYSLGFVARQKEGLYVYYRLNGRETFQLCDIMCGRIEKELKTRQELFR
jgi:DNA-binding transcriptional ArsR family regulator